MSTRSSHDSRPIALPRAFETLVLSHFILFVLFVSWAFGGQIGWARQGILAWGTVGVALFFIGCWLRTQTGGSVFKSTFRWLWPLALFDLLVVASCFNPNFKEVLVGDSSVLVQGDPISWLPSSARPNLSLKELWQFNVIVLTCFNVAWSLSGRRRLRLLLFVMAGNGVLLAVFGTFQKLVRADGLWFGLVKSPNPKFFATFIYHNHWGAFTILNTAICLGLLHHFLRRGGHRDFWHSPALLGTVLILLFAASVPLSASRSCTVLLAALLTGSLIHFMVRIARRRRERHESALLPVAGITLAAVLAAGAVGYLGREAIAQRTQQTVQQVRPDALADTLAARLTLYRDTWRMAEQKPWFGWGLESYAHVFRVYNTQRAREIWFGQPFYAEAHNDWLQSLAEVGFIGTALLGLLLLLPWLAVPWRRIESTLPRYLLAGCGIILLYAWLEFPFANPAVMLTFCATYYVAIRYAAQEASETSPLST